MHAVHATWTDDRMDDFAARTDANFAEVRGEVRDFRAEVGEEFKAVRGEMREEFKSVRGEMRGQGESLCGEIRELGTELRIEIKEQGRAFRGEIGAARDHADNVLAGLRAEMNLRFASLERRFDIMIGALVSGVVGLIVTHLLG